MKKKKDTLYCSFCAKPDEEVSKLIAGPTVFICDQCISLCVGICQQADKDFFNKIRSDLLSDKKLRRASMQQIDAPDEFWDLMDESDILERMAGNILHAEGDLTDHLFERAHTLTTRSRKASRMAWKMIHDAHPELNARQMTAAHGQRKIYID